MTLPSLSSLSHSNLKDTQRQGLYVCQIQQKISTFNLVQTLLSVAGAGYSMKQGGNPMYSIMSPYLPSRMQSAKKCTKPNFLIECIVQGIFKMEVLTPVVVIVEVNFRTPYLSFVVIFSELLYIFKHYRSFDMD